LQDLRDNIDDFDRRARILNIAVTRDDWPPQRAVAGIRISPRHPVRGPLECGDAVKEYANGWHHQPAPRPRRSSQTRSSRPTPRPYVSSSRSMAAGQYLAARRQDMGVVHDPQ
jgi:hypothetical protein